MHDRETLTEAWRTGTLNVSQSVYLKTSAREDGTVRASFHLAHAGASASFRLGKSGAEVVGELLITIE
jgi:hypothetical protein